MMSGSVRDAAARIAAASRIVVLTGAGMSAESGVPTFRGPQGLWRSYRPEELATPEAFERDPRLVWEWYNLRRVGIARCTPNAAHLALARFALGHPALRIITQNVDELHSDAARREAINGDPARALPLELHGSIFRDRCSMCAFRGDNRAPVDARSIATLPRCEECGALLRPDVVWFGERLAPGVLEEAFAWAGGVDLCIVIGTSGVVEPAASIASITRASGGQVIEVNPDETPLTRVATISIRGTAVDTVGAMLPQ
jgi:NAD-dependent deacetylase